MKELQARYSEEELAELINDGGIQECKHSNNGRITMYIDHSNWQNERRVNASRSLTSSKKKSMDDDEDQAFDSFLKMISVSQATLSAIEGVKQWEAYTPIIKYIYSIICILSATYHAR